jgi:SNF2 family DNA or RNA helicase
MNFITGHGMLVFPASDPIAVRSVLPHAKSLEYRGKPHIAVRHDLDAVTILRNIGINAPSPVNHGWDYPGRYKPFDHQRATVEFLTVNRRAFVLSGMGSGKTAAALWATEYLRLHKLVDKVVIVCPKSCTHKVWEDEIFNTLMHRSAVVIEGGRERKLELAASDADFLIVNHDGLATISSVLAKDPRVTLYIYDEASAIRNSMTNRYKTLKGLLKPATRLWLLTATPCPNQPTDAWALARLVRPETVPPYFLAFKRQTMIQVSNFKWVPKPEATQMAYAAMQPAIRFRTEDCIDLPPVTYQNRACDLSPEQHRMMEQMRKHLVADNDGATITAANAAVKLIKILQLAQGAVYDDTGETQLVQAPDRLATLKEIIEEADHKVIVWCPFKHVMKHLKTELSKDWGVELINGDTSAGERTRIISAFQQVDQDPKVLIAHPATAAHGLTLVSANICVWYGPTFSSEMYEQANARVARPGQKHHMTVIHLGSVGVEWDAYGVAASKIDRQKKVLDLYRKLVALPASVV